MWFVNLLTGGLASAIQGILGVFGKTLTDIEVTKTNREISENQSGVEALKSVNEANTAANNTRADVQKSQGTWGPFGILSFLIGLGVVFHTWLVVGDSTGWNLVPVWHWGFIPWLEWAWHQPGTWGIKVLPGMFEQTEHNVISALFYTAPPATAAVTIARMFRK